MAVEDVLAILTLMDIIYWLMMAFIFILIGIIFFWIIGNLDTILRRR